MRDLPPLLPLSHPSLLSVTSYDMTYPFGEFRSAAHLLPNPNLLALRGGGEVGEGLAAVSAVPTGRPNTGVIPGLFELQVQTTAPYGPAGRGNSIPARPSTATSATDSAPKKIHYYAYLQ